MWDYRNVIADSLSVIADWLSNVIERLRRPKGQQDSQSKFLDLAPTDNADKAGVYADALFAAMGNPKVFNIALTGPYGSGKSSIIKSFLKRYRRDSLQISLAAFLPGAEPKSNEVTKQEIERSILQQMLYGANANKLPFSRFKRIQAPGRWSSRFVSLYITLALFSCWHLLQNRNAIVNGDYFLPFAPSNWFNLVCFALVAALLWLAAHRFYVASFGVSLKSLSLKDIEITPAAISQESILNRHLDEIIYFFQSTKYDLVIIEDLDRFNDPEIFVTLREINKIVNENPGVRRPIRFLYALRDDMFVNTDRTKFFEFIIPVIPIINSSNSIDMVIEQAKTFSLDQRLNPQFLREVSRYLGDLRLIKNIFNEYAVYVANLETDGENVLDANKLLAVLIYKNVYPSDFEALHRREGSLAKILDRQDQFVANAEAECKVEISRLEGQIDAAAKQLPADLDELRRIYAMVIIENVPDGYAYISIDGSTFISIQTLAKNEGFEQFLAAQQLIFRNLHNNNHRQNMTDVQALAGAQKSFQQRKSLIEKKSADFTDETHKTIRELRAQMSTFRVAKFNEIVRRNADEVDDLFKAFSDNAELARFLVFEGFLDDTYYHYTSLFHAGRLSPSDDKFLKQIRGHTNPAPEFQIDNPKEVVAEMRHEDFGQRYVLNVKIVDCLHQDPTDYHPQTTKMYEFIASDFQHCAEFFRAYYASGANVADFLSGLVKSWEGFIPAAIASARNQEHVARIIAHLPSSELAMLAGKYPAISAYVAANLPQIMALGLDFAPERLKDLQIEALDLSGVESYPTVARFLFDEGLYQISAENIDFIFRVMLAVSDRDTLKRQNYASILKAGNAALCAKIDADFEAYLQNVLLVLPENSAETVEAILATINRDDLEIDDLRSFLEMQSAVIPDLAQIPVRLHAAVFELEKIEPSWENCLAFLLSETYDSAVLTSYLNKDDVSAALSRVELPDGKQADPLRTFLIENDALDDDAYSSYVRMLPKPFPKFPEDLSWDKLNILIVERKVFFTSENLSFLSEDRASQILFVEKNVDQYLEIENECTTDDDFRESLLGSNISDEKKLNIIKAMDLTSLTSMPSRAAKVGPIMERVDADFSELNPESSCSMIVHSKPIQIQISLCNKLQQKLNDQQIKEILGQLPEPFSDIKPGWDLPRVESTAVNLEFVTWLKSRRIISSWKRGGIFDDDIRIHNFRK